MKLLAFSNCPLDPLLGSGQTRLAWTAGIRARGHEVTVWDSDELLGASASPVGRRWRMSWAARQRLAATDLSRTDLVEFYGAEFWLPTWWLSRLPPHRRPLLVAHTDGLELACAERMLISGAVPRTNNAVRRVFEQMNRLAFSRSDGFVTASRADQTPSLPNARPRSDRLRCGGRESKFLAVALARWRGFPAAKRLCVNLRIAPCVSEV